MLVGLFVSTRGTREALALSSRLVRGGTGSSPLLFLWGPPASGKTRLLRSVVARLKDRHPAVSILQRTGAELREDLLSAVRSQSMDSLCSNWARADVVALDDLHVFVGMPTTQREVARLLSSALGGGARAICTAGCAPALLPELAAVIRSVPHGHVVELGPPSEHEMRRIVTAIANANGLRLEGSTVAWIAAAARGDVRRAVGALTGHAFRAQSWRPGLSAQDARFS